ncbi:MAG: DNA helicase RecQ [Alphaproteobacteria bacterium]
MSEAGGGIDAARRQLAEVFGYADFRPGQEAIIRAILAGEDVLAIMPTGSGKSLCYQLPAIVTGGLTVVVSPLIALMRDQVRQLRALGVSAASVNSANHPDDNRAALRAAADQGLRLLYLAPERFAQPGVTETLSAAGVGRLAIDEAHCVSEWGHDFRPDYLGLGAVRDRFEGARIAAFTATADAATRADIADKLFHARPRTFVLGFDRPNLKLAMRSRRSGARQLAAFVAAHRGASGIVYCASRRGTEETAAMLRAEGHRALAYHAGMEKSARDRHQDAFQQEDGVVMTATVAFGMGIDKPDIRFVGHAEMPSSIESYYQEIGRAGRDGLPADTLMLYGLADIRLRRRQIDEGEASEARKRVERRRLDALVALCEAPVCRRQTLLGYFGEMFTPPCGHCDLCLDGVVSHDGTVEAQKVMSAILRTGERFGVTHLINVLRGELTEGVTRRGHERLPTFGVGKDRAPEAWRSVLRQLYATGLVDVDIVGHGGWSLTPAGRQVLFSRAKVRLRAETRASSGKRRRERLPVAIDGVGAVDEALLARLKALRTRLAKEQDVPAYVVFADRTLIDMAARRPRTIEALRAVHGVGAAKLARFGAAFLQILQAETEPTAPR